MNTYSIPAANIAALLLEAKDDRSLFLQQYGPDDAWEVWFGSFLSNRLAGDDRKTSADRAATETLSTRKRMFMA